MTICESAKPFLPHLQRSIMEAGGHMLLNYQPDGLTRAYLEAAGDQLHSWKSVWKSLEKTGRARTAQKSRRAA